MRLGLVSPYSWSYPGGVNRHVEALAEQFAERGHEVRVFAPVDPDTRRTALLHRGARPHAVRTPEWLVPLGGTIGWPSNGAISNLALHPTGVATLRRELRAFAPDLVHVHEPNAPMIGWDALMSSPAPLVGTFHTYSTHALPFGVAAAAGLRRRLNRLRVRIAVSEAAAWTGRRFQGGEYRVIPNGVTLGGSSPAGPPRRRAPHAPLRIAFVGQTVERKGLPLLLAAFEGLRAALPAELVVMGAGHEDVAPLLSDPSGVHVLGRVDDERKHAELAAADVLVAPSLGGESFGMVLTEAFAAGTPVIASDIAGYRDVVRDRVDGLLVPPGDPTALAEALREVACEPELLAGAGRAAAEHARRYAWPAIATEVERAYGDALAAPALDTVPARLGLVPVTGGPRIPARREPPLDPAPPLRRTLARRAALGLGGALAVAGTLYGLHRIGPEAILRSLLHSQPSWVVFALGLMCLSMVFRAVSWHAFLRGALPEARPRFTDAMQGTAIGVLMSATLPARLGEPARALIVARRLGRPRERLPVVLGTLVGQTLVNVLALVLLGVVLFMSVGLFAGHQHVLVWYALTPVVVAAAVLVAPSLLRASTRSRRMAQARMHMDRVRSGLAVLRRPRLGAAAVLMQLGAWAIQWLACFLLLVALGLEHRAGMGAAAAVLFAVNVSAVLPVTPSNLGVFQAACVAVLSGAYGVRSGDALAYGIVLQCVEVVTAVLMGGPALVREGLSWRDVRLRTMHATPVVLGPRRDGVPDQARYAPSGRSGSWPPR
jgi:phosphatidyl-myo-inositol alpha-mannosyltransferase